MDGLLWVLLQLAGDRPRLEADGHGLQIDRMDRQKRQKIPGASSPPIGRERGHKPARLRRYDNPRSLGRAHRATTQLALYFFLLEPPEGRLTCLRSEPATLLIFAGVLGLLSNFDA